MKQKLESDFLKEHPELPFILRSLFLIFAIIFFIVYIASLPVPIPFSSYIPLILAITFFVLSFPSLEDSVFEKLEKLKFPKKLREKLKSTVTKIRNKFGRLP